MEVERIKSVQSLGEGRYRCIVKFVGEPDDAIFVSDPNDPYGGGPAVRFRIATLQYDGEITPYVEPPPPVPQRVTRAQAKIALLDAGLLDRVETAVKANSRRVQLWFADAQAWERENPHINALGAALGLSAAQIDDLFHAAAKVS
jgi:hypothetical protein